MCTAAPSLTFWLMPVVVGLLLAPWMVLLTSRRDLGLWAQRIGVFATPEECVPPSLLVEQEAEQDNVVQLPLEQIGRSLRFDAGWAGPGELVQIGRASCRARVCAVRWVSEVPE